MKKLNACIAFILAFYFLSLNLAPLKHAVPEVGAPLAPPL